MSNHRHGLHQWGRDRWYDGVAFGTQCPILPRQTFTYEFTARQVGTYWWHAHSNYLRGGGLAGPLIIEDPNEPFTYDGEKTIIIGDWWNQRDAQEMAHGLQQQQFRWIGDPQSILVNGKGCEGEDWTACLEGPAIIDVEPGKTYRLRIINVGDLSYMNFLIEGHNLTVVEVDGHYVEPFVTTVGLEVNIGNRYSVLLTADQAVANYWAHAQIRFRTQVSGQAVLRYAGAADELPLTPYPSNVALTQPVTDPGNYDDAIHVDAGYDLNEIFRQITSLNSTAVPVPQTYDRQFIVVNSQERMTRNGLQSYTEYRWEGDGVAAWASQSNVDPAYANDFGYYESILIDGQDSSVGYLKWPVHVSTTDDLPTGGDAFEYSATPLQLGLYYGVGDLQCRNQF